MKRIPLTRGKFAVVDDEEYHRVNGLKWTYLEDHKRKGKGCAVHWLSRGKYVTMANFILGVSGIVDHRGGDRLDNRRANLRPCSQSQNNKNKAPHRRQSQMQLSHYKGVYYRPLDHGKPRKKPYFAQITSDGKHYGAGYHHTPEEAALAYNDLAIKYHGEFARLNEVRQMAVRNTKPGPKVSGNGK